MCDKRKQLQKLWQCWKTPATLNVCQSAIYCQHKALFSMGQLSTTFQRHIHQHLLNFCWSTSFDSIKQQKPSKCRRRLNFCPKTIFVNACRSIRQSDPAYYWFLLKEHKTFVESYEIECECRWTKSHHLMYWNNFLFW